MHQLRLVPRRHHHEPGQGRQIPHVEAPGMRRPVSPDQPRPINRKPHRQPLQCHVMHDLVIAALQEGRVDRDERLQPRRRHPCGKGDPVLLGDPHVEHPPRKPLRQDVEPGARRHRRRDPDDPAIPRSLVGQRLPEHVRVSRRIGLGLRLRARGHVELGNPMILVGRRLRRGIALALDRHRMDQNRPAGPRLGSPQRGQQRRHVMPIDRADIGKAQLLEQGATPRHPRHQLPCPTRAVAQRAGQGGLEPLCHPLQRRKWRNPRKPVQILVQRPHRRRDAHVVVVQDHEHPLVQMPRRVHRLIGHPGGDRAIANHRNRIAGRHPHVAPDGEPQRRRDRG